ncbi:hypothetical protein MAUB1S_02704 [Mycolicibacterium aubagnense]
MSSSLLGPKPGHRTLKLVGLIHREHARYTYYSIYPVAPDVPYDKFPFSHEWIQATGIAPNRLTVEIKQRDTNGEHRLYTIGHQGAGQESGETEPIENGDNTYLVRPSEVLTATDAIPLFHYYETHSVPDGWSLREQPEFSDTAAAEQRGGSAAADDAQKPSPGTALDFQANHGEALGRRMA